jgi:LuxR family transcriptional regulator, maltose regulon positive regulatory protein
MASPTTRSAAAPAHPPPARAAATRRWERPVGGHGRSEVPRPQLVRRLTALAHADVVLLRAPAGYGKTTLLAQWAAAERRSCARVGLRGCSDAAQAIPAIAGALCAARAPRVLMLDDADALQGPAGAALLALLATRLGEQSLLALAARTEPALPLARLRLEGRLVELSPGDLALDADESALLLAHAGIDLPEAEATALIARAEGWPAGLLLAARSAAATGGRAGRLLGDYTREQLLAGLGPRALDLLLRSAPLGELSGELCDAVLERRGSGVALRDLARGNVPLVALDRDERRFRLHPLLSEALLGELRRRAPRWEQEAHRRAAGWHERRGEAEQAIDHAVSAGEAARAGALLWRALPAHALGGAPARLRGRLDALGAERVAATPALALAAALARLASGNADEAARLVAAATRAHETRADETPRPTATRLALVRSLLGGGDVAGLLADGEAAHAAGVEEPAWRALACLAAGLAEQLGGRAEAARARLEDGAWCARSAPLLEALCLAQLTLLALDEDDPQRAEQLVPRMLACVGQPGCSSEPLGALPLATAAFAHARSGRGAQARRTLAQAQQLRSAADAPPAWYEAELRFACARTQLRLSDAAGARPELVRMSRALRTLPDAPLLRRWIDDAWARADAFAAGAVAGPSRLTLAELRVVRLLPSHLSTREIAARLHVSANTVKTQAHAVYRKLDVCSRSEAVARARQIGLVDSG